MRHGNLHSDVNQKFRYQSHPPRPATKGQLPHQLERSVTDEVGDEAKIGEQRTSRIGGGRRYVARAESSCEFLRARGRLSCSTPRQLGSSAPREAKSVSAATAKVLRELIKRNDNERLPRFFDCREWKTTARPRKHCPAAPAAHARAKSPDPESAQV